MNTTAQTITESSIRAELFDIAQELVDDGFTVYYLPDRGSRLTRWIVFGKADDTGQVHTGTVELAQFNHGLNVSASIRPSRAYGSSLAMQLADSTQDYYPYSTTLDACRAAAQPTVRNFLNVTLPNDGIGHFDWCNDRLVNLTSLRKA